MIPWLIRVFDYTEWDKDLRFGNWSLFRQARLIRWYNHPSDGQLVIDVQFIYDGRISCGHFWTPDMEVMF